MHFPTAKPHGAWCNELGDQILRRLARISIVFLLLLPLNATSLGLGDIQLRSALNEPLDARIGLHALGQTRVEDIVVGLASREAFGQAGLDRPPFLSDLTFTVEADANGQPTVRISSTQPIAEPFLDFLVEMNWPNGRLVREYTVLIDPPLLLDEAPMPIAAATAGSEELFEEEIFEGEVSTPAAAAPRQQAPASVSGGPRAVQVQQDANGAWSYGTVQRNATLWSIAQELQSLGGDYSTEQIMLALLRDNPEAFYNGNVNELKAGYVLRIEDPATVGAVARAEAIAEVRRQAEQWMDAKRGSAALAENRPQGGTDVSQSGRTGAVTEPDGPRLRLSAPDALDAERLAAGTNEGESESGTAQNLRQELATALEVSESARQENIELRQRLAELEEQLGSMQRLIRLQEDSLATMQVGAGAEAETTPAQPAESAAGNPYLTMLKDYAALLNDPFMMGVAGVAVLLLLTLGWLIHRRRQVARAALEDFTVPTPASVAAGMQSAVATAPMAAAGGLAVEELDEDAVVNAAAAQDDGVDIMQAGEDEIDVLAEADVYLAYRRFDKAEELLKDAMRDDPGRSDLMFKLLEVYAASGDVDSFVLHAEALQTALDGRDAATWNKVVAMGRQLAPDHELFAGGARMATGVAAAAAAVAVASAADEAGDGFDIGGFDFDSAASELDLSSGGDAAAEELHLDLDAETLAGLDDSTGGAGTADTMADAGSPESFWQDTGEASLGAGSGMEPDAEPSFDSTDSGVSLSDMASKPASDLLADDAAGAAPDLGGDIDWLSAVGEDFTPLESDLLSDDEDFEGLISGTDEIGTKLDLAKAYIDMGDQESALNILNEVSEEGSEDQQREASALRRQIG